MSGKLGQVNLCRSGDDTTKKDNTLGPQLLSDFCAGKLRRKLRRISIMTSYNHHLKRYRLLYTMSKTYISNKVEVAQRTRRETLPS